MNYEFFEQFTNWKLKIPFFSLLRGRNGGSFVIEEDCEEAREEV